MARVRVHQHVNPFAPHYRQEQGPIYLAAVFAKPERPLHIDIGCARGRFILKMAETEPNWNYLGLEIREPLVTQANEIAAERGLANLQYVFCNAMFSLGRLLGDVPDGCLQAVTIQFPDPCFKRKHAKRRMVNRELVSVVVEKLAACGSIFVQTDIEFLADEMFDLFRENLDLTEIAIEQNPYPVQTEREKAVENKQLPIYRAMFKKE